MYDDGLYRAWSMDTHYPSGADLGSYSVKTPDSITILYSESKDGYAWQQKGSHTIPVKHGTGFDGACFFIDDHGKPQERYKAIFHASMPPDSPLNAELWERYARLHPVYRDPRIKPDKTNAMFGMTSPDGVHWKLIEKPLMTHYGDTRNTLYYDEWLKKYVLYTRLYWCRRRMVARATSAAELHHTEFNLFDHVTPNESLGSARILPELGKLFRQLHGVLVHVL